MTLIVGYTSSYKILTFLSKRTAVTDYLIAKYILVTVQIQFAAVHHSVSHSLSCDDDSSLAYY